MKISLFIRFLIISSVSIVSSEAIDSFDESLMIRPLEDGKLHTRFSFDLTTLSSGFNQTQTGERLDDGHQHPTQPLISPVSSNLRLLQSDLIPISILELVNIFDISQLSLSLSRGRWEHDRWYRPIDRQWVGYPRGAQLSFRSNQHSMNTTTLINSLAGIFCASLNRLELSSDDPPSDLLDHLLETTTRSRDHHHWNHSEGGNSVLHHGILPIEQPCTENLTPLIRLLPCDKRAGLASLVDSHRIFDSNWQSLRLKILNRPDGLDLRIEIEAVLNPIREISIRNWSFKSIFGKSIESKCPLASTSKVEIIENQKNSLIEPRATEDGLAIDGKHTFDIMRAVFPLEIEMKWPNESNFIHPKQYDLSPIEVKRIITGYGQNRGKLGVEIKFNENKIRSNDEEKDFVGEKEDELIYFEQFPWWLSIYLHTLTIKLDDHPINPNEVILEKKIKASLQRERSYLITLKLKHPDQLSEDAQRRRKGSMRENGDGQIRRMRIDFEYEKDLLLYTEYSSDANRGFDLSPALVIHNKLELVNNSGSITSSRNSDVEADFITDGEGRRIKTKSSFYWSTCGLISLATPDFSMPYNVIIVTSTVIALFFGSVFNLLVREFKIVKIKNSSK